jgi:hypothetical protein
VLGRPYNPIPDPENGSSRVKTAARRMRRALPPAEALYAPAALGILYAVVVAWMLSPLWSELFVQLIGDADTDAVRGMWGFDHLRRSLLPPDTPIWSHEINFPNGVMALILPWVSGMLATPASTSLWRDCSGPQPCRRQSWVGCAQTPGWPVACSGWRYPARP